MPYSIPASSKQKADVVAGSKRVRKMNMIGLMDGYLSSPEKNFPPTNNYPGGV